MKLDFGFKLFGDKITVECFATPIYNPDGTRSKDNKVINIETYYVGDTQDGWTCGHTFLGEDNVLVEPFLPDTISDRILEVLYKTIEHEFLHATLYIIGEIIASVYLDRTKFVRDLVALIDEDIRKYWSVNGNENPKENPTPIKK